MYLQVRQSSLSSCCAKEFMDVGFLGFGLRFMGSGFFGIYAWGLKV